MTLAVRLIPCLDVAGGRVVKGLRFESLRDAGDPVEAAIRYEREGADEVTFLDIAAATEARGTLVDLVSRVAATLSIPFTVGGGVRSVEDAGALLAAGADRVSVNSAAVADPGLVTRLAERFGSQCVVVAVDGKRVAADGVERMLVTTHGGRRTTEREVAGWVREVTGRGAGEILLTSVDADGTKAGFDIPMLRAARQATDLPIIASGGAGTLEHFTAAVLSGRADAVLAASVFHDRVFSIGQVKRAMAAAGVPIRLVGISQDIRFDEAGLVPVVVQDARTRQVLTVAYANAEAIERTRETASTHLYSRSRRELWRKGETSGHTQQVLSISSDCDADAVVYEVIPNGPACHTGAVSCFSGKPILWVSHAFPSAEYGLRTPGGPASIDLDALFAVVEDRARNPQAGSYTNRLLEKGIARIAQKVGEEGVETALAAVTGDHEALAGEAADLLYHLVVLLVARGVAPSLVEAKLAERRGKRREEG